MVKADMKIVRNPSAVHRTDRFPSVPAIRRTSLQSRSVQRTLHRSRHLAQGGQGKATEDGASGGLCIGGLSGDPNHESRPAGRQQAETPIDTPAPSPAKHPVSKPLKIMRDKQVWWCGGVKPFQYDVSAVLSAGFASGGVFRWDIVKGSDKVDFENDQDGKTKVNNHKIGIRSTDASGAAQDITVRCSWSHGNLASTLFHKMTVLAPSDAVVSSGPNDSIATMSTPCGSRPWCPSAGRCTATGYITQYLMEVRDQFGTALPRDIEINETFDTFTDDFMGNNWPRPNFPPNLTTGARFGDSYGMMSCPGRFRPQPLAPSDKLASNKIKHATQIYRVGSLTPGRGLIIRHHKAQYYLGRGRQE